jgi:signal transduction histidine kinase
MVDQDLMVECNKHYITQLLDNLISNADKYGKNSLIEISLRRMNSIMVEFKITDHGIGIPKKELSDVFKSFTTSSKTKTPAGGRGLGLALCQKVIDAHQGKILAESDSENGTTFLFVIPFNYHYKGTEI